MCWTRRDSSIHTTSVLGDVHWPALDEPLQRGKKQRSNGRIEQGFDLKAEPGSTVGATIGWSRSPCRFCKRQSLVTLLWPMVLRQPSFVRCRQRSASATSFTSTIQRLPPWPPSHSAAATVADIPRKHHHSILARLVARFGKLERDLQPTTGHCPRRCLSCVDASLGRKAYRPAVRGCKKPSEAACAPVWEEIEQRDAN